MGIYVRGDLEKKLERMREWTEKQSGEERMVIGGDFNARTGEDGGWLCGEEEEDGKRKSKDKKINEEGRKLLRMLGEVGWTILNGNVKGDEEGEFTYTGGRGETVIDYVISDEGLREKITGMEVGDRIDSDHHPLIVTLKGKKDRRRGEGEEREERRRGDWSSEGREEFRRRTEELEVKEGGWRR